MSMPEPNREVLAPVKHKIQEHLCWKESKEQFHFTHIIPPQAQHNSVPRKTSLAYNFFHGGKRGWSEDPASSAFWDTAQGFHSRLSDPGPWGNRHGWITWEHLRTRTRGGRSQPPALRPGPQHVWAPPEHMFYSSTHGAWHRTGPMLVPNKS